MTEQSTPDRPSPPGAPSPTWGPRPTAVGQMPQPGWYWAPLPQQRTSLGHAGLTCGAGAMSLALLWILFGTAGPYIAPAGRVILTITMLLGSLTAAIVAIVLSARGMSRRFINRGPAIAGLVIGIIGLVVALGMIGAIIVAALMYP